MVGRNPRSFFLGTNTKTVDASSTNYSKKIRKIVKSEKDVWERMWWEKKYSRDQTWLGSVYNTRFFLDWLSTFLFLISQLD